MRKQERAFLDLARQADRLLVFMHGGKASCPIFDDLMAAAGGEVYIHPSDEEEIELSREFSSGFGDERFNRWVLFAKIRRRGQLAGAVA